jgi:hypothetical protein
VEVNLHEFLTSALGDEFSASRFRRITLEERTPSTHRIGNCVDPGASLDMEVEIIKRNLARY